MSTTAMKRKSFHFPLLTRLKDARILGRKVLSYSKEQNNQTITSLNKQDSQNFIPSACSTIYDIIIPGTHDSAAYCTRPELISRSTFFPLLNSTIRSVCTSVQTDFALTQNLSVIEQLRAGARFLDLRVTKRPPSSGDDSFWTHHGMVLCTKLEDILEQINQFHTERQSNPVTVVLVVRAFLLDEQEEEQLAFYVPSILQHPIYQGTADELRTIPLADLPPNIVAGLKNQHLDIPWGQDAWIDTYNANKKISFLAKVLNNMTNRVRRTNLFVLGWTVTPSIYDVVFRVFSIGMLRPSVKTEAVKMNARFPQFFKFYKHDVQEKVNVIFFDCFTPKLGQLVDQLNSGSYSDSDDSADLYQH